MKKPPNHSFGFTLVELIITILLVGILAVTVAPRFDIGGFQDDADAVGFISHLRYAQHRAMVTGGGWSIAFTTNSYSLHDETGTAQQFPNGVSTVSVSAISSSRSPLYFDYFGAPDNDASSSNINGVTTQTSISIGGQTIKVEPYTGGLL